MKYTILLIPFLLFSCASKVKPATEVLTPPTVEDVSTEARGRAEEQVDVQEIKSKLKMDFPVEHLGYREKKFNTCEVGAGYSTVNSCRRKTLVVIHFQLLCRSSEGTVSEVIRQSELQPINNQSVKWNLNGVLGETFTNAGGFGQIAMIATDSQRTQRLRLTVGNDFLAIRAGDANQLIAPGNWCR